jgi:hypothetical protein
LPVVAVFEVASEVGVNALTAQGIGSRMILARMGGHFRDAMALVGAFDIDLPASQRVPARREGLAEVSVETMRRYNPVCNASGHMPSLRLVRIAVPQARVHEESTAFAH